MGIIIIEGGFAGRIMKLDPLGDLPVLQYFGERVSDFLALLVFKMEVVDNSEKLLNLMRLYGRGGMDRPPVSQRVYMHAKQAVIYHPCARVFFTN